MLSVPYFEQENENACGAAAFGMVYKYYRPSKLSRFSQNKMFLKRNQPAAADPANRKISTADIVAAAKNRGLQADWGRISTTPERRQEQLAYFLDQERVPLIACQRFSDEKPILGHFRVLLAADSNEVIFHDPFPGTGGPLLRWQMEKFIDFWKHTSPDVEGGVAIWVADRELENPLDPKETNLWK